MESTENIVDQKWNFKILHVIFLIISNIVGFAIHFLFFVGSMLVHVSGRGILPELIYGAALILPIISIATAYIAARTQSEYLFYFAIALPIWPLAMLILFSVVF